MSYQNRDLIRKPLCLLRASKEEREKLISWAEMKSNGGAVAPTLLDALLALADKELMEEERRHAANARQRTGLDRNAFGALLNA